MLRHKLALTVLSACIFLSGCASIVHSGPRSIPVSSQPPGAKVSIYDRDGTLVMMNTTPFVAKLTPKYAYFKGQSYRLVFEMPGQATSEIRLAPRLSGWYFGNIVFGGLLGMVVIDPLTGAMYNLSPQKIQQSLTPTQTQVLHDGKGFLVVLMSQTTEAERAAMVPLR
jgi:hypothetical protein